MGGFCRFPQILWNKNLTTSSEYNVMSSSVGLFGVLFPPKFLCRHATKDTI